MLQINIFGFFFLQTVSNTAEEAKLANLSIISFAHVKFW